MIKVNILKDEVRIKGHSNYEVYGKDIVCAAVSSIVTTTINAILKLENNITFTEKSGEVIIKIIEHTEIVDSLISNMVDMLEQLEKNYSKNIKINK